jgi:hypothetical protein
MVNHLKSNGILFYFLFLNDDRQFKKNKLNSSHMVNHLKSNRINYKFLVNS